MTGLAEAEAAAWQGRPGQQTPAQVLHWKVDDALGT